MRISTLSILMILTTVLSSYAQESTQSTLTKEEQQVVNLSKDKWQWMADKNVDKLAVLFDDKSKFVHMSGTWKKNEELEIIKTGTIWYKKATVHDTAIEISGKTAIVWNRITLESEVRGSDAKVEFTVTKFIKSRVRTGKCSL